MPSALSRLPRADSGSVRRPAPSGRSIVAAAFADPRSARRALAEVRSGLGDWVRDLALSRLSLDGHEYMLLAGSFADESCARFEAIVGRHQGTVVDEIDEDRTGARATAARRAQAQNSYS